jgi:transposase IS116/IS110/IS902 family protein
MRQSAPVSSDLALAAASGCPTSRRFTEAGFARFTETAPIPASSGEAGGRPIRHRLNRGGNRRLKAAIHRAAISSFGANPELDSCATTPYSVVTPAAKPCGS